MKIELIGLKPKQEETQEFKERQQNIDALLILAKLCEAQILVDDDIRRKAQRRISSLIDKI